MRKILCIIFLLAAVSLSAMPVQAQVAVRAPGVRVNVGGAHGGFNRGFGFGGFNGFNRGFAFNNFGFNRSFAFHNAFAFNQFSFAQPFVSQALFAPGCSCSQAAVYQQPVVVQQAPVIMQQAPVIVQQQVVEQQFAPACGVAAAFAPSCGLGIGAVPFLSANVFAAHGIGHHRGIGFGGGRSVIRQRTVVRSR